jgi:hypothetical protein
VTEPDQARLLFEYLNEPGPLVSERYFNNPLFAARVKATRALLEHETGGTVLPEALAVILDAHDRAFSAAAGYHQRTSQRRAGDASEAAQAPVRFSDLDLHDNPRAPAPIDLAGAPDEPY